MSENSEKNFDGMYLTALLFKHKRIIIATVIASAIISTAVAFLLPVWYTASVNAVPPQTSMSGLESAMGNISSTLRDIGLARVGGSSSSGYSLTVVLLSRSVKDSIIKKYDLRKVYKMENEKYEDLLKEFESNLDVTYDKEGNYVISITDQDPKRAASMANDYVQIANHFAAELFKKESNFNRIYMEYRIKSIDSTISAISEQLAGLSQRSLMFSPEEQARAVSQAIVELKAQVYQSEIEYDLLRTTFGESDALTQVKKKLLEETRKKLNEAMNKPGFAGNFKIDESGRIGLEFTKMLTEIEALSKAKAYLVPLYEKLRLDEAKNIKTLYVLDEAIPPTKKSKPKRVLIVAGSVLGSFVLTVLMIILVHNYIEFRKKYQNM
jgi:LPS O-antigen subunit length determinant protein (WzzB/FepE family)